MTKPTQTKSRAGKPGKPNDGRSSKVLSKCTLSYKTSQPNSFTVTAKFKDASDDEVKETVHSYKDGDSKDLLIELQKRIIALGDRYK